MALFWNRHAPCEAMFATLRAEIAELRTRVASAESTVSDAATTAYKHMKKGEAAARRALEAAEAGNQGRRETEAATATPLSPPLTGARARIAARRMRLTQPVFELPAGPNGDGVHP